MSANTKNTRPGKYTAKAFEGVFCKVGEKHTPAVGINFEFKSKDIQTGQEVMQTIWAVLYLSDAARERSMDTLVGVLGYNGNEATDPEGRFMASTHLADKEVELVLEVESYEGNDGKIKETLKVKWINELGGQRFAGAPVASVLGNLNLKAEVAAAKARLGMKATTAAPAARPAGGAPAPMQHSGPAVAHDGLPF